MLSPRLAVCRMVIAATSFVGHTGSTTRSRAIAPMNSVHQASSDFNRAGGAMFTSPALVRGAKAPTRIRQPHGGGAKAVFVVRGRSCDCLGTDLLPLARQSGQRIMVEMLRLREEACSENIQKRR